VGSHIAPTPLLFREREGEEVSQLSRLRKLSIQLNLAHVARKKYEKKKLKQMPVPL